MSLITVPSDSQKVCAGVMVATDSVVYVPGIIPCFSYVITIWLGPEAISFDSLSPARLSVSLPEIVGVVSETEYVSPSWVASVKADVRLGVVVSL